MSEVKDVEFLEYIVRSIVDNPDAVKINREVDERGVLISLDVDAKDMGMIIGRQGSTAKAIRTLLRVIGARNDSRVNLKINEPEGSDRAARQEEGREEAAPEAESVEKSIDDIVDEIK
ncbi:MAG TPA: KH domain-containing protein [Candidatus Moranbacteria bacterium]|nr:KH domain-containing protein [Candidatus Moranbacteria bacterium]